MSKLHRIGLFLLYILMNTPFVWAQTDSLSVPDGSSEINLKVQVDKTTVPMNRPVELLFTLQWTGELDRFDILPFDNPILNNFEITANSSSNRVTSRNGVNHAVREYQFTLLPQSMGMGYVESLIIRYTDMVTDTDYTLTTNRIEIKVIDPVPEPGDKSWMLWVLAALVVVAGGIFLVLQLRSRKAARLEQKQLEAEKDRPVEEKFLQELKSEIDLNNTGIDVAAAISDMTRLTRRFIAQKHQLAIDGKATEDIVRELQALDADAKYKNDLSDILTQGDILKFSGGQAGKDELERMYGLLESNLYKSLQSGTESSNTAPDVTLE